MIVGDLFSGIGGFSLAAHWLGWHTAWYSEIDPYACRIMAKNFPGLPNLGDITTITNPPPVDLLCGGFPCQDISIAGKGAGLHGAKSSLWFQYLRIIGEVRPSWVVIENSPMLRSRGLDVVLSGLDALGYDAEWHCIPASSVGAPHQRDRLFVVANANSAGLQGHAGHDYDPSRREDTTGPCSNARVCGGGHASWRGVTQPGLGFAPDGIPGWLDGTWENGVPRVVRDMPDRVNRLKCLGNAVVPQVVVQVFSAIAEYTATQHTFMGGFEHG